MIAASGANEIVLGDPGGYRVAMRVLAVGLLLFAFIGPVGSEYWSGYYEELGRLLTITLPVAVWAMLLPAKIDRIISINDPPGVLVVTRRSARILGAWPFLRRTTTIPLALASRGLEVRSYERWLASPDALTQSWVYQVLVPTESGNTFVLYSGTDRNAADHIAGRVRAADMSATHDAPAPAAVRAVVDRQRKRTSGQGLVALVAVTVIVLMVAVPSHAFGDTPVCPAGYKDYDEFQVGPNDAQDVGYRGNAVKLGFPVGRWYKFCGGPTVDRPEQCLRGDVSTKFTDRGVTRYTCERLLLVPKYPLT